MARKAKGPRRRRNVFRLFNFVEAFAYASLMTKSFLGTNPVSFFTSSVGFGGSADPQDEINLQAMLANPDEAFAGIMRNAQANGVQFLIQSGMLGIGFRLARRVTSGARSKISNYMVKPLLGKGVAV